MEDVSVFEKYAASNRGLATGVAFGRFMQALIAADGDSGGAKQFVAATRWSNKAQLIEALDATLRIKAGVAAMGTGDLPLWPVVDDFLALLRPASIALQMQGFMHACPFGAALYSTLSGAGGATLAEGAAIPLSALAFEQPWVLRNRKVGAMTTHTQDAARIMTVSASKAIAVDITNAAAAAENTAFASPWVSSSVFNGAPQLSISGTAGSNVVSDLKALFGLVAGAWRVGTHLIMSVHDALFLAGLTGTNGSPLFPNIGPMGGTLWGVPVLVNAALENSAVSPPSRYIGLVDAQSVFYADDKQVDLQVSTQATLQMDSAPSMPAQQVGMFGASMIATKSVRYMGWYARPGSTAFLVTAY
jgi:hypothetical protein